jgi:lysophospholipase L1-like esterase
MIFQNLDRIVFAGDSVTDMGSSQPVGEGLFDNCGHGYVRMVENLLSAIYPEICLRITNSGISGHTSRDLLARFDRDVVSLNPDWVSICIGINDIWRQFDVPAFKDWHVDLDEYRDNMEKMILAAKDKVKGIFILTPYYIEPNREDWMRKRTDEYVAVCKELAEKHGCIFVDFQAMFEKYCSYRHSCSLAWDRVHPNEMGATLMAREFLKHCDFDYNHEAI